MPTAAQVRRTGAYVPPHVRDHDAVAYGTRKLTPPAKPVLPKHIVKGRA